MTPQEFIAKWKRSTRSERSASQEHFLDLCELLRQPKPAEADPEGTEYTFERGVRTIGGDRGWADVWKKGRFGWEYKRKHKDLKAAYDQLLKYREDLENPPLLVVCDMDRFEVHTNFPNTVKKVYAFDLHGLAEPANLAVLRNVFTNPDALKPGQTSEAITRQAAELFGQIADGLRQRGIPAETAAHFLMKLMFCMFAEDIELLQNRIFTRIVDNAKNDPAKLSQFLRQLFEAMCTGSNFGADEVLHFNGGLFRSVDFSPRESNTRVDSSPRYEEVVDLSADEIKTLITVNRFDWSSVEPSIFGTLFERTLDPAKRSQIGAHYTSRDDILTLLEPVMMTPLRREWAAVREQCDEVTRTLTASGSLKPATRRRRLKQRDQLLREFVERLADVTVLDPACGSGNFLYVALHLLLDLEKEVIAYAARQGIGLFPHVRPTQLAGIEINRYAQELAQVVIWIGYLQWMRDNGFAPPRDPVLEPIESIRLMDAILDLTNPAAPLEPEWPEAEFIVGNPPFLGDKLMRGGLGHEYVEALRDYYSDRLPKQSDICCYWFEKARRQIELSKCKRAGLLATQGIRGGSNRETLKRIKGSGDIFFAESDRNWVLDGAVVHVSMVGFDNGTETERTLDSVRVPAINANLTTALDVTTAQLLPGNASMCFLGVMKAGQFDMSEARALQFLRSPNPHGKPNSDVLRPRVTARDILQRAPIGWIVDFGCEMPREQAALFEKPWGYVEEHVFPKRKNNRRTRLARKWWIHGESRPGMRNSLEGLERFIITPEVSKHRIFVWLDSVFLADHQTRVFPTSEDWFFGVVHSRPHEVWARAQGTQLRERESGFRYTPTTCFETFPFPDPTDGQRDAIAAAAKELDRLRNNWLNPPEWTRTEVLEFPGTADGPWKRYIDRSVEFIPREETNDAESDSRGMNSTLRSAIGTVRYPRVVPRDEDCAKQLKQRTLTNLYNERPTWLALAHRRLDEAVFAAYGWDAAMSDDELLAKLLALNLQW